MVGNLISYAMFLCNHHFDLCTFGVVAAVFLAAATWRKNRATFFSRRYRRPNVVHSSVTSMLQISGS